MYHRLYVESIPSSANDGLLSVQKKTIKKQSKTTNKPKQQKNIK